GSGRAHGAGRAVEGRQGPIASGLHDTTTMALDLLTHEVVVVVQELPPLAVAEPRRGLRRTDDVGEHDSGEDAVEVEVGGLRFVELAGDEPLDLADDGADVSGSDVVVGSLQLDVAGIRDARGRVAPL